MADSTTTLTVSWPVSAIDMSVWGMYPVSAGWVYDPGGSSAGGYGIVPTSYTISGYTKNEEVKEMRGLFAVSVVDPGEGEEIYFGRVVAKDAKNAEFKVLSRAMRVTMNKFEIDDLDVISTKLGNVRARGDVQEVRIVKEG